MKITDVKVHLLDIGQKPTRRDVVHMPGTPGYQFAEAVRHEASGRALATWLRIITDQGHEGWFFEGGGGNSIPEMRARAMGESWATSWRAELVGENPLRREYLWQKLNRRGADRTGPLVAADVALWDLAGKAAGMSIARLAGSWRDMVPCYHVDNAYRYLYGELSPETAVQYAVRAQADGFVGYKDHSHQGVAGNIAVFEALRESVGPDWLLMHDAAGQYTYPQAVQVGRALDRLGYYWFEEPIRDYDLENLVKLADELDVSILAGEVLPGGIYSTAQYIRAGALDIVRNGASKGGATGMLKQAHLAEAHGLNCEPVSSGPCYGFLYVQLLGAMSNAEYYETSEARVTENAGIAKAIGIANPLTLERGHIRVPEGPGLGMELDRDRIEDVTLEVF